MTSNYDPDVIFGMNIGILGHPMLPAGYNFAPINGDEIAGPGLNFDLYPVTCASDQHFAPSVNRPSDFEMFGCPSRVIPGENRVTGIQQENRTIAVTKRCAA